RAYVLRSPHAHAKITTIDVSAAKAAPGVLLVLKGDDPNVLALGVPKPQMARKRRDGLPMVGTPQPFLARDRVRYNGQPVALVVAETLERAKDAAELIAVEYEDMTAVTTLEDAIAPGAPAVWDECHDNIAFLHEAGDRAATDKAIAAADVVIRH